MIFPQEQTYIHSRISCISVMRPSNETGWVFPTLVQQVLEEKYGVFCKLEFEVNITQNLSQFQFWIFSKNKLAIGSTQKYSDSRF